jgi:hypothetical protein
MISSSDLLQRAKRLRELIPPRQTATPPQENGRRIGVIKRSANEQIRVNWATYEGSPYVAVRLWTRNDQGQWWPDKKGMSVRLRELPELAEAIAAALDLAQEEQQRRDGRQPSRPMPGRPPANLPPVHDRAEEFNEFE